MSKSETREGHAVRLLDSADDIRAKIMRATTDSSREIVFDEQRPGIYNLLVIYELFSGSTRAEIESRFEGKGYAVFKRELAEVIIEGLKPLQSRYRDLVAEPSHIDHLLAEGATKVRPLAERTLNAAKSRMGLG